MTSDTLLHGSMELTYYTARGTSELGDYGMIVGDPLLALVAAAVPDSRGYAVQVITLIYFLV